MTRFPAYYASPEEKEAISPLHKCQVWLGVPDTVKVASLLALPYNPQELKGLIIILALKY